MGRTSSSSAKAFPTHASMSAQSGIAHSSRSKAGLMVGQLPAPHPSCSSMSLSMVANPREASPPVPARRSVSHAEVPLVASLSIVNV